MAAKAQKKVPVPEGLDLDEWINDEPVESEDENMETNTSSSSAGALMANNQYFMSSNEFNKTKGLTQQQMKTFNSLSSASFGGSSNYGGDANSIASYSNVSGVGTGAGLGAKKIQPELSEEDLSKYRETRKMQIQANPFYIKTGAANIKVIFEIP